MGAKRPKSLVLSNSKTGYGVFSNITSAVLPLLFDLLIYAVTCKAYCFHENQDQILKPTFILKT